MRNPHSLWLLLLLFTSFCVDILNCLNATAAKADVGVILDLNEHVGKMCKTSISMAIEDFYSKRDYNTMIQPHFRDSKADVVAAASAAIDLLKNSQVMAILGPQMSIQAEFVKDIGDKVRVPIISPATSPSVSTKESPYFIRSAWCSSSQVKAIAAIVKKFGWREVIFVYEDTSYGSGIVPFLTEDLLKSNALVSYQSVISSGATDDAIRLELCKLMKMRARVFVVHMLTDLASRFFKMAKEAGMMDKGYAWIIADVLTSLLDSMDSTTMEAMQGVIGVKAYTPESNEVNEFRRRWKKRFHKENPDADIPELNVFGLWAYDSITALAEAIEHVGVTSPRFKKTVDGGNLTELKAIGTSRTGPLLVPFMKNFTSKGLSGDFNISNGQLQPSAFEIVNLNYKRETRVGFWTEESGISKEPDGGEVEKDSLYPIVWPGKTDQVPKGWEIPTSGKKLRVGVPNKPGFSEFVKVKINEETKAVEAAGFSIAVFEKVWNEMPYAVPIEYVPFEAQNTDYDELVKQLSNETFDAVVGDVTITAIRSKYADFTLPFTESGIAIVVPIKDNERKNAWIFMKPLTSELWITTGSFFVFIGVAVWVFEHRVNDEFQGPVTKQVGMMFWFSFSTLVFAHREKVYSNLTRFVLIVWVFVVLVLTSSYTANLTSMLTIDQLRPKFNDVNDLIKNKEFVGYQKSSFVRDFLTNNTNLTSSMLISFSTLEEFHDALTRGSRNGGVGAVIDELPYIRLLLSKYCDNYTMIGPTYPTSGLGFAFPKGSPLALEVSHKILQLKETEEMVSVSENFIGDSKSCPNADGALSKSKSLDFDSFKGLFLIAGISSSLALVIFVFTFLYENRDVLRSDASTKEKVRILARVFTCKEKDNSFPARRWPSPRRVIGVLGSASPDYTECDQEEMFRHDEGLTTIEITPIQPANAMPQQEATL